MLALASLLLVFFPLGLGLLVWRRVSVLGPVSRRLTLVMGLGGALAALFAAYFEKLVLSFTGLSLDVATSGVGGALLATFLLAAPLEEALKVSVVWPLYRTRRIVDPRLGVCYASCAGAGFSAVKGLLDVLVEPLSRSLALAPVDEEELTPETVAALDRAHASLVRGEGISHEEVLREFGL